MLTGIVRFTDDAAGLEKSLRLVQYICQTIAALLAASPKSVQPWSNAYLESARARRYFRLLKWHESFGMAHKEFYREQAPLRRALEVSKWSFLGLYFLSFFEMFTITNEMGVTNYSWAAGVQREADKYWLYAIAASILVSVHQLLLTNSPAQAQSNFTGDEKDPSAGASSNREATAVAKTLSQLAIDCADIIIPAVGLGWVPLDEVYVGVAGTVSTLIAGYELWIGVQSRFTSIEQ